MKTVYIIRHAKSSWEDAELPDVVRPLNPRGKKASNAMGHYLAKLHDKPDLIVSSPATRAYHTAVNMSRVLGYRQRNIIVQPAIYFEGEQGVFNTIRHMEDAYESVFIIGHEPTCSEVIYSLCGEMVVKFSTGAVFKMQLNIDKWKDIYEAKGKKIYFITPKEL